MKAIHGILAVMAVLWMVVVLSCDGGGDPGSCSCPDATCQDDTPLDSTCPDATEPQCPDATCPDCPDPTPLPWCADQDYPLPGTYDSTSCIFFFQPQPFSYTSDSTEPYTKTIECDAYTVDNYVLWYPYVYFVNDTEIPLDDSTSLFYVGSKIYRYNVITNELQAIAYSTYDSVIQGSAFLDTQSHQIYVFGFHNIWQKTDHGLQGWDMRDFNGLIRIDADTGDVTEITLPFDARIPPCLINNPGNNWIILLKYDPDSHLIAFACQNTHSDYPNNPLYIYVLDDRDGHIVHMLLDPASLDIIAPGYLVSDRTLYAPMFTGDWLYKDIVVFPATVWPDRYGFYRRLILAWDWRSGTLLWKYLAQQTGSGPSYVDENGTIFFYDSFYSPLDDALRMVLFGYNPFSYELFEVPAPFFHSATAVPGPPWGPKLYFVFGTPSSAGSVEARNISINALMLWDMDRNLMIPALLQGKDGVVFYSFPNQSAMTHVVYNIVESSFHQCMYIKDLRAAGVLDEHGHVPFDATDAIFAPIPARWFTDDPEKVLQQ